MWLNQASLAVRFGHMGSEVAWSSEFEIIRSEENDTDAQTE